MYSKINSRKKCLQIFFLCTFIITSILLYYYYYIQTIYDSQSEDSNRLAEDSNRLAEDSNRLSCYKVKAPTLPDIMDNEPPDGNSIFFLETSCKSHVKGRITINARQACAVESAARMNPDKDVYLLYTSPGTVDLQGDESDRLLSSLLEYKNVKLRRLNFKRYLTGTPVEELYRRKSVQKSQYPESHASDLLRYLTLWKYGGIYLDLDIIVIRSLEGFSSNFAAAESDNTVNSAVMSFSTSGWGHELAKACLYDLRDNFNGTLWANNGPGVITRLLGRICGVNSARDMEDLICQGFHVYDRNNFYPVPWEDWKMLFDENSIEDVFHSCRNSSILHVWNYLSKYKKIPLGSRVAYMVYADEFCPKVVQQCEQWF